MYGRCYGKFPYSMEDTEEFQSEVVDVFGGINGSPEYASFRLYATDEVISFGLFNEGLVNELDVASTKDLIGRQYHVHVREIEGVRRIVGVGALDFSCVPEGDIELLEKDEQLFGGKFICLR